MQDFLSNTPLGIIMAAKKQIDKVLSGKSDLEVEEKLKEIAREKKVSILVIQSDLCRFFAVRGNEGNRGISRNETTGPQASQQNWTKEEVDCLVREREER